MFEETREASRKEEFVCLEEVSRKELKGKQINKKGFMLVKYIPIS